MEGYGEAMFQPGSRMSPPEEIEANYVCFLGLALQSGPSSDELSLTTECDDVVLSG